MKRLFTLSALLFALGMGTTAQAQSLRKTWDFREGFSTKTINALKADQEEFGDSKYWRNYESDATKADEQHFWNASGEFKNSDGFACTHNGGNEKVISELEGLKLGASAAKKFVITYNGATYPNEFESEDGPAIGEPIPHGKSYVWLNGKNETITFQAEVNQTIKIGVESHAVNRTKVGEARGISLTASTGSLSLTKGKAVPTYYTECEWELTGDAGEVATMTIKSTNGCHIYYIIVGNGDDPNANKTKVGYLTAGDATSEAAYQTIAADESFLVTPVDAATVTAEQLQSFQVTVVSPELPADNAAVEVLKQALPFTPVLNLNASLYAAWGYGEAATSDMNMALITNIKHELFGGFVEDVDYSFTDEMYIYETGEEPFTGVRLGEYFAGDATPAVDGSDETLVAIHVHNPYHNAYIYVPFGTSAASQKVLFNAIEMAKSSKSEVEKTPAPKISIEYKNLNTNIALSMSSSALPKPQIFYTLDGSEPTMASTPYTDVINVTTETTVKAVAIAEGYLLSDVAEAKAEIFSQPATPAIAKDYQDGKTLVSLSCETENTDIWYNFTEGNDTTKSMKYTEPITITITLPTDFNAFAVAGGQVFSEMASERIVVKNVSVRQDKIGEFDANFADWQNGGGSTVYYFSWGKTATSMYDTTVEPIDIVVDSLGDEIPIYPERIYEYYMPSDSAQWVVKSKGQVMIWQSLTIGKDPGNDAGYNPETAGDLLSYATPSNNDIQFGGKVSGEVCTGTIQSRVKWAGPFDVVTVVGTAAGGDNVGRMQLQVSKDSLEWTNLGDEMTTSKVKRLWKSYTRSYNEQDEVYVRIIQAGGGSSVQIYNMFILNEGDNSKALKEQYDDEFNQVVGDGILSVSGNGRAMKGIYNLSGVRHDSLQRGLNIIVNADGQVRKVMVK